MYIEDRIEKKYKYKIFVCFFIIILGLSIFLYGIVNLPGTYPGEDESHDIIQGQEYDKNSEYQKVFAYQTNVKCRIVYDHPF